jgi:beta-barrel assembly-enhancing protease
MNPPTHHRTGPRAGGIFRLLAALALAAALIWALAGPGAPSAFPASDKPFKLSNKDLETLRKVEDFERMLDRRGYVMPDDPLRDYVVSVGQKVLPQENVDRRIDYQFHVMRSPEANAFALPNGSIYVTVGLISLLENEGQLAAVLAHEVTHAANHHYFRFERQYKAKSLAMNLFVVATPFIPGWGAVLAQMGAEALYVGTIFGYSRDLEQEADTTGLVRLASAGYDAEQMPASFQRLMVDYEGTHLESPVFYSDHPKLKARVAYTEEMIRKEGLTVDPKASYPERYAAARETAAREEARLAAANDLPRTAIATAGWLLERRPRSAEAHALRADGYRALGHRERDISTHPPGASDRKRQLQEKQTKTPEEIEKRLDETKEGRAAWEANAASAEADYRKALDLDPEYADAHLGLALLYDARGRHAEALEHAEAYLAKSPEGTLRHGRARQLRDELKRKVGTPPATTTTSEKE